MSAVDHHHHSACDHGEHKHFTFPRNRLFPPLIETDTWRISPSLFARVVRVAPKSSFPAHPGMVIKVLRGETNEVPTPLAPCKACRSCTCPEYLSSVIAGAEGAILLVCWQSGSGPELKELEEKAVAVHYSPSATTAGSDASSGVVESSFTLSIVEGETYVCDLQFHHSTDASTQSKEKTYSSKDDGLFGEVGVAIHGLMKIVWKKNGEDTHRVLKVPAGYEYGPFYAVDSEGHLERTCCGQLNYAPHSYLFEDSKSVWATVRLPVVKSDVAGPHRHCYT